MATGLERVLAFYHARRIVVAEIKRQGYKLTSTTASEIAAAAKRYLSENEAQCLAHAAAVIAASPILRKMIERQERDRDRRAIQKSPSNSAARNAGKSASA
jgi:hypothetical protein